MSYKRAVIALAVAILLVAGFTILPKGTAHAFSGKSSQVTDVTCSGTTCNNTDPVVTGCSADATTLLSSSLNYNGQQIGEVDERYSPTCQTYWSKVELYSSDNNAWTLTAQECTDDYGGYCADPYSSNTVSEVYSNQLYLSTSSVCAEAFGYISDSSGNPITSAQVNVCQ